MLEEETKYSIRCDRCGEVLRSRHESNFDSAEEADDAAIYEMWDVADGKYYCPECQSEMRQEEGAL